MVQIRVSPILFKIKTSGLNRDLNPGPLAPKARIIPLDHWAIDCDILKNWPSIIRLLQGHTTCQTWPSTAVFKQIFSCCYESLYSSVAERWSCKPKVMSSILIGGSLLFLKSCQVLLLAKKKVGWPRRDSNTQPSDLESDALPLRHGVSCCK